MRQVRLAGGQRVALAALRALALGLLGALATRAAWADTVQVAVAANMAAPMQAIAQQFQRDSGHQAVLVLGATGKLSAQVRHGAPFEVLVAADAHSAAALEAEGLAVPGTRRRYGTGQLVLWSMDAQRVDAQGQVLRQGGFRHLALANPQTAPYGAAAVEVMQRLGLRQALQARWVQGESVAQTYQFVASGNAELGFVALSQVWEGGKLRAGSAWIVPATLHAPLHQEAVLLRPGQGKPAAQALLAYLGSEGARSVLRAYGYRLEP